LEKLCAKQLKSLHASFIFAGVPAFARSGSAPHVRVAGVEVFSILNSEVVDPMKWNNIGAIASLSALVFAGSASAANIAFVSFHNSNTASAAAQGVLGAGADAPDKGYTDLLTANGHTVTRILTADNLDTSTLNSFDLVIVGRSVNSAHYQQAPEPANWHSVLTKPAIFMGGYTLRNVRLGYTTGGTIPDTGGAGNPTGEIKLEALQPGHPIFAGVTLDGSNIMVNNYTTPLPTVGVAPATPSLQRGISVNTDPLIAGGTVLAKVATVGDPANSGTGMIIGSFPAGTLMGTGQTLSAPRLVFLSGTREANGHSSETAGFFDLTADGQRLFLNAVAHMASVPEPATPTLAVMAMAGLGLFRRRAR
jgi:uncharacterized protein (TIGR03382 family)